jgi:hypothetical protein
MLRSSLKPLGGEALCAVIDLEASQRAEDVTVAQYMKMAEALNAP